MGTRGRGDGDEGISAEAPRPGLPSHPTPPRAGRPPTTVPRPRRGRASLPAHRLPIRYPGGSGAAGEGKVSGPRRGRRGGDAAVAPRGAGSKSARARGASKSGRRPWRSDWQHGGPSESSHTPAAAGTSYWMYCFLHSGVMCAERCSANFILTFPPHSRSGPAVTGGGSGGGGNSDSDSSPHGPRRGAALSFSPPPPPPRSPQCRPPAIFLLLSMAPPSSPAHYTSSPW